MLKHLVLVLALLSTSAMFAQPPGSGNAQRQHGVKRHSQTDTVGTVNGHVISLYDFRSTLSENIQQAAEQGEISGDSVTPEAMTQFVNQTWNELVDDILLESEVYRRHLNVNDSEAINYLVSNPSPAQRKDFSDSTGKFNRGIMRSAFHDPANDSVVSIIVGATKLDMEHDKLLREISGKAKTEKARREALNVWLREQRTKAIIVDHRTSFGSY